MKKLIYAICMGAAVAFSSCEDMLDTTNYTEKTTATFPESYDDAQQMIAGVYASMASVCANPERSFLYYAQLASDDALGGGGSNDKLMQAMDLLCNYQVRHDPPVLERPLCRRIPCQQRHRDLR